MKASESTSPSVVFTTLQMTSLAPGATPGGIEMHSDSGSELVGQKKSSPAAKPAQCVPWPSESMIQSMLSILLGTKFLTAKILFLNVGWMKLIPESMMAMTVSVPSIPSL